MVAERGHIKINLDFKKIILFAVKKQGLNKDFNNQEIFKIFM